MPLSTQGTSSYTASFPSSWKVGGDSDPSQPLPGMATLRGNQPPGDAVPPRAIISSKPDTIPSRYLTEFPPSWVLPPRLLHSQSQINSNSDLGYPEGGRGNTLDRQSLEGFGLPLHSQMTLRPPLGDSQGIPDTRRRPAQAGNSQQSVPVSASHPGVRQEVSRVSLGEHQNIMVSALSRLAPASKQGQDSQLLGNTSIGLEMRDTAEHTILDEEDDHFSDQSGRGDVPHPPPELADAYSTCTDFSAFTNQRS